MDHDVDSIVYAVRLQRSAATLHRVLAIMHRARIDPVALVFAGDCALVRVARPRADRFVELVGRDPFVLDVQQSSIELDDVISRAGSTSRD